MKRIQINMEITSIQTLGDSELYNFLINCPKEFELNDKIKKYKLRNGDFIHCVLWNSHFYISGTDIVKILIWRFQHSRREIGAIKKFEEGIFSDLRNLKPGVDATLEGPRSEFLEFLYKNGCIRTQKKQKVFYWYSVPHDELFFDALQRDQRRDSNTRPCNRYISEIPNNMQIKLDNINYKPYNYSNNLHNLKLDYNNTNYNSNIIDSKMYNNVKNNESVIDNKNNNIYNLQHALFGDNRNSVYKNQNYNIFDTFNDEKYLNITQSKNKIFFDGNNSNINDYNVFKGNNGNINNYNINSNDYNVNSNDYNINSNDYNVNNINSNDDNKNLNEYNVNSNEYNVNSNEYNVNFNEYNENSNEYNSKNINIGNNNEYNKNIKINSNEINTNINNEINTNEIIRNNKYNKELNKNNEINNSNQFLLNKKRNEFINNSNLKYDKSNKVNNFDKNNLFDLNFLQKDKNILLNTEKINKNDSSKSITKNIQDISNQNDSFFSNNPVFNNSQISSKVELLKNELQFYNKNCIKKPKDLKNSQILTNNHNIDKKINNGLSFDDFELGQFNFLKDRCKHHYLEQNNENSETLKNDIFFNTNNTFFENEIIKKTKKDDKFENINEAKCVKNNDSNY